MKQKQATPSNLTNPAASHVPNPSQTYPYRHAQACRPAEYPRPDRLRFLRDDTVAAQPHPRIRPYPHPPSAPAWRRPQHHHHPLPPPPNPHNPAVAP